MFAGSHFYHGVIRKTVAVFGTIFNDVYVVRTNQAGAVVDTQRVPIAYGPKQKFLTRLDEQPDVEKNPIAIKLPRMAYEITGLTPDPSRNLHKTAEIRVPQSDGSVATIGQLAPYKLAFALTALVKNQDDGFQIVEQIAPYFKPEYTVAIKYFGSTAPAIDVPFVLTRTNLTDLYEGTATDRRAITFELDFEAPIWFYGPIGSRGPIKTITMDFMNSIDPGTTGERVLEQINPITAKQTDQYTVDLSILDIP